MILLGAGWPPPGREKSQDDGRSNLTTRIAQIILLSLVLFIAGTAAGQIWVDLEDRRLEARSYIEEARDVHVEWIDALSNCELARCAEMASKVGPVEYHREWVRRYDFVLEVLK